MHILFISLDQTRAIGSYSTPYAQHGEFFILHKDITGAWVRIVQSFRMLSDIAGSL